MSAHIYLLLILNVANGSCTLLENPSPEINYEVKELIKEWEKGKQISINENECRKQKENVEGEKSTENVENCIALGDLFREIQANGLVERIFRSKLNSNYFEIILGSAYNSIGNRRKFQEPLSIAILFTGWYKITKMFVFTLMVIGLILVKAAISSYVSFLVSLFIIGNKLYSHTTPLLSKISKNFFVPIIVKNNQYEDTSLDLSGYGYNSFSNGHLISPHIEDSYSLPPKEQ